MSSPSIKDHKGICEWFRAKCEDMGLNAKREVRIGKHIADLTVNDKVVIEIQVTTLTPTVIADRISTYLGLNYRPIWVLSGEYYARARMDTLFGAPSKISKFERIVNFKGVSYQKYIYYYGEGWMWRGEPNFHKYKSSLAWINLKRCGFETQLRSVLNE